MTKHCFSRPFTAAALLTPGAQVRPAGRGIHDDAALRRFAGAPLCDNQGYRSDSWGGGCHGSSRMSGVDSEIIQRDAGVVQW
jgi:hypothetical protein